MEEKRSSDSLNQTTLEHEEVLLAHAQLGNLFNEFKITHSYHLPIVKSYLISVTNLYKECKDTCIHVSFIMQILIQKDQLPSISISKRAMNISIAVYLLGLYNLLSKFQSPTWRVPFRESFPITFKLQKPEPHALAPVSLHFLAKPDQNRHVHCST